MISAGARRPALEFYVSPSGSDGSGDGSRGNPWATPDFARAYLRGNGYLVNMGQHINVNLAAGDYWSTALAFTDADSGTNRYQVRYRHTDQAGGARLSGGRLVTGWSLVGGSIYRVALATPIQTMWENGIRAVKARTPAYASDGTHPLSMEATHRADAASTGHAALQYVAGDLTPGAWSLTDAQIVTQSGGSWSWFTDVLRIASLTGGTRTFNLTDQSRYVLYQSVVGSRYYVQGVLDLLTGPGQFHYDSAGQWLYYWARDGAIASQQIVIPTTQDAVTMLGADSGHLVTGVVLDGLTIQYSDFPVWYRQAYINDGDAGGTHIYPSYDRSRSLPVAQHGTIRMENTTKCAIQRCHIRRTGLHGLYAQQAGTFNRVTDSFFEDVSHTGVYLDGNYPGEGDVLNSWLISNFKARNVGQMVSGSSGITFANSGKHYVANFDISGSPRFGVTVFAYTDIPASDIYAGGSTIELGQVTNCMQDSGDGGSLYMFGLGMTTPNVNTWRNINVATHTANAAMGDIAPNGLFCDAQTAGQTFQHIKVVDENGGPGMRTSGDSTSQNSTDVGPSATVDPAAGLTAVFPTFAP